MKKILFGLALISSIAYATIEYGNLTVKGNLSESGTMTIGSTVYPGTFSTSDLLYASGSNTLAKLTTANTSALVTNSSGVPSWTSGGTANRLLRTNGTAVTFGQAVLTTDVSGVLPIANGGTTQSSYTKGDILYASATNTLSVLPIGSTNNVLQVSSGVPAWGAVPAGSTTAPTVQKFTSTGSTVGYIFTVSATAAGVAAGCVYTNNGHSYTVATAVLTGATTIFFTQASAPAASGTLTYSSGGGVACNGGTGTNLTFSAAQAYATYTAPTLPSPLYIRVIASGGGGGGGSSTSVSGGSAGGVTYFGAGLITCTGGGLGSTQGGLGIAAGGSASAIGLVGIVLSGGSGTSSNLIASDSGMPGATNALGGGGAGGQNGSGNGADAAANSGAGGGGSGANGAVNSGGGGGGAGGYVNVLIANPSGTYAYAVGAAGAGEIGTRSGGAGGAGVIVVEEYYQ